MDELATKRFGLDTETTGRGFSDLPFVLTIATDTTTYFFDLHHVKPRVVRGALVYSHNAKFDLMMLTKLGVEVDAPIHCTMVAERILRNDYMDYSLAATAKRYGLEKDSRAEEYIKEHGLYEERRCMGVLMEKAPLYAKLPPDILQAYACTDAMLHYQIGEQQRARLNEK
jgi:DNA polymerase I-like protein with 3'-5' exonuclease and polymerase domains